jgi:acyl-CoA oxidase
METHLPVNGVQVGDIGKKLGYNGVDNSWLIFNQVRIPRENMLSKLAYLSREGAFSIRGDLRVMYTIMVGIRTLIIATAGPALLKCLKVAVRYAACRRQFQTVPGSKVERKILDYQS